MRRRTDPEPTPEEIRAATPEHPSERVKMPDFPPAGHCTLVTWDAEKMCVVETLVRYEGMAAFPKPEPTVELDAAALPAYESESQEFPD